MKIRIALLSLLPAVALLCTAAAFTQNNSIRILSRSGSEKKLDLNTVGASQSVAWITCVDSGGTKFQVPASGIIAVANGGTGAATAAGARSAIGVGEWTTNTAANARVAIGIQYGSCTTAADNTVTNTFSTPFTVTPRVVIAQQGDGITTTNKIISITTSNFVYDAGAPSISANWVAIGTP